MSSETQSEKWTTISSFLLWYSVHHREEELGLDFSFKIVFYLFFNGFLGFTRVFSSIFLIFFLFLLVTLANDFLEVSKVYTTCALSQNVCVFYVLRFFFQCLRAFLEHLALRVCLNAPLESAFQNFDFTYSNGL